MVSQRFRVQGRHGRVTAGWGGGWSFTLATTWPPLRNRIPFLVRLPTDNTIDSSTTPSHAWMRVVTPERPKSSQSMRSFRARDRGGQQRRMPFRPFGGSPVVKKKIERRPACREEALRAPSLLSPFPYSSADKTTRVQLYAVHAHTPCARGRSSSRTAASR